MRKLPFCVCTIAMQSEKVLIFMNSSVTGSFLWQTFSWDCGRTDWAEMNNIPEKYPSIILNFFSVHPLETMGIFLKPKLVSSPKLLIYDSDSQKSCGLWRLKLSLRNLPIRWQSNDWHGDFNSVTARIIFELEMNRKIHGKQQWEVEEQDNHSRIILILLLSRDISQCNVQPQKICSL